MSDTLQGPADVRSVDGTLLSLVYVSEATVAFSDVDLALLLATSRANNLPRQVTGLLLHDAGRFMQALEGPEAVVRRTFAMISADPRHRSVRTLEEERIEARRFGSWAMGYRSVAELGSETAAWFGSPEAVAPRAGSLSAELLERFRIR